MLIFVQTSLGQNMTVNNNAPFNSPYWLAENVLVDPQFVIFPPLDPISGLPINQPSTIQVGHFSAVGTGFPIDSGIVMCANHIQDVLPSTTGTNANTGPFTDPDLSGVLTAIGSGGYNINDRAQITFSFIATSDSISFNYVFGSHEYPTYTCSNFNDVFGFFLTGPGINGNTGTSTVNLATIPNSTTPVAINTINQGSPGTAGTASNCLTANPNYVANSVYYNASNGTIVSLGGYTQKFTAQAQVTCGQLYTIRLAIANVSDHALSSAVFLEANSFKAPGINITGNTNNGNSFQDSNIVEGCAPTYVKFEKHRNVSIGMGINLSYSGSAIGGVDYATLPDSIWIPPGQKADSIMIEAFDDGIVEPDDSLVILMEPVYTTCYLYPAVQKVFHFRDKDSVVPLATHVTTDTIFCPGDTVSITGSFTGGEGNVAGAWVDDPSAPQTRVVSPTQTTTYYYYAYDECMTDSIVDSVTIYLADYIPMTYNVDTVQVCRGDTASFTLNMQDGNPPYYIVWPDSSNAVSFSDVPQDTTFYVFEVYDQCGVFIKDSMMAIVSPDPLASFSSRDDFAVPLRVVFTNRSQNAVSYFWDFGDGTTSTDPDPIHDFPEPGTYTVTLSIVTAEGCEDIVQLTVEVKTDFYLYIPTAFTPDGDGLNECFEIKGTGFDGYEIKIFDRWGNQVFYADNIEECWNGTINGQPAPAGAYTYRIFLRLPFDKIATRNGVFTLYR